MQTSVYQANRQQLLMMGSTIFVSVTAAVIVSTLLIMSLMRGEIANALTSNVQNSTPTSQVASTCAAPTSEQDASTPTDQTAPSVMPEEDTASEPLMTTTSFQPIHAPAAPSIDNSFNSTNISNVTTTNNVTNTELHKTTVIKDSFNKDSYNDNSKNSNNTVVVKDNKVTIDSNNTKNIDSNNTVDIDKKTTNNITNNVTTTDNSHSNNVIVKDNDVDILSDNKVVVPVLPVVPLPVPAV